MFVFFSVSVAFVLYATPFVTMAEQGVCGMSKVLGTWRVLVRVLLRVAFVVIIFTVAAVLPVFAPIAGLLGAIGLVCVMRDIVHNFHTPPRSTHWWCWCPR